jgi:hypothetical protein
MLNVKNSMAEALRRVAACPFREIIALSVAGFWLFIACPPAAAGGPAPEKKAVGEATDIEAAWGIRPLGIRLAAGNHFLDFRFLVTDGSKAAAVTGRREKAHLVHQASGKTFPVPITKLGPMRATSVEPAENRVYAVLFSNLEMTAKAADKVDVVIGELRIKDLVVNGPMAEKPRLPEAGEAQWTAAQTRLLGEYRTCSEDCARDRGCIDRCRKAFDARTASEYRRILGME